jgi:hypothetical protein
MMAALGLGFEDDGDFRVRELYWKQLEIKQEMKGS